jgi:hypothetical protein
LDIFIKAETAYYGNINQDTKRMGWANELHLEPLFGPKPGEPVYLSNSFATKYDETTGEYLPVELMSSKGRALYAEALRGILHDLTGLKHEVGQPEKIARIQTCIENVLNDIGSFGE